MDLVDWAVGLEVEGVVSRNQAVDMDQGQQLLCCISSKIVNVDACCIALLTTSQMNRRKVESFGWKHLSAF